jgi:hypothetical protein
MIKSAVFGQNLLKYRQFQPRQMSLTRSPKDPDLLEQSYYLPIHDFSNWASHSRTQIRDFTPFSEGKTPVFIGRYYTLMWISVHWQYEVIVKLSLKTGYKLLLIKLKTISKKSFTCE